jgi:hypothetical protein
MSFPTDWTDNMDNSNCTQIRSIVQPCASCRDREETTMHGSREVRQDRSVAVRVRHERWASPAARLRSHSRLSITLEGTYNEARHMMDVAANQGLPHSTAGVSGRCETSRMTDPILHAFSPETAVSGPMTRKPG